MTHFASKFFNSDHDHLLIPGVLEMLNSRPTNDISGSSEVQRTDSGGIQTAGGTLYISKPIRSSSGKKSKAVLSFVPRQSTFDSSVSGANEFRGFFPLFWISIFLLVVQNYVASFEAHGYVMEMAFAHMFSRHALALALSDAALVGSTGLSVVFAIALKRGWFDYYYTGLVIQHTMQTIVIFSTLIWTYNRQWPWVQSGYLTLHALVMVMKMHSYMATNGRLSLAHKQHTRIFDELRSAASNVGGWDTARLEATDVQRRHTQIRKLAENGDFRSNNGHLAPPSSGGISTGEATPELSTVLPNGTTRSYIDADMAQELRSRLLRPRESQSSLQPLHEQEAAKKSGGSPDDEKTSDDGDDEFPEPDYAVLVHHPDSEISERAEKLVELDGMLISPAELQTKKWARVRWPNNISLANYADYQIIPTLVYELAYPRTERIRPLYVFEKTVATFGTFALLYTMTENFILPRVPSLQEQSFAKSLLDLALPFMVSYLLLFYIIFECICNGFAELSRFADRQFYEDWWNSTSQEEFSRKWNKPVHMFLLRHVYSSTRSSYHLSKTGAMFITFLLSASAHELVMVVVTKKLRFYLFAMQLSQLPMIMLGRLPFIKRNKVLGNVVFWIGLYTGFPLLCVAYCAY